jgi:hypothetical protein
MLQSPKKAKPHLGKEIKHCPKCGKPGSSQQKTVYGGKLKRIYFYYYFAHYNSTKRKLIWHYVGKSLLKIKEHINEDSKDQDLGEVNSDYL